MRYLKYAGILGTIILFLYWLSPRQYVPSYSTLTSPTTAKCTKSHDPSKPLTQYALMIDAGSTGSRIHAYRFNNCGPTPELEHELFEQTAKREGGSGLSSYDSDAEGAAASLDPLLEAAIAHIPQEFHSCSPIAVKATAGLRKLGPEKSYRILHAVRLRLEERFPFPLVNDAHGGVEVMEGTDEGVYAWITTNYLLGKIGSPSKTPTAAVFDLGGGSTQIVFEPTFPLAPGGVPETLADGEHKYNLTFGGRDFTLYQHSYLGYGLMAARESLHQLVVTNALSNAGTTPPSDLLRSPLTNPCIAPGLTRTVDIPLPAATHAVTMTGPTAGSPAQCRALAEKTLLKDAPCALAPCAFAGIHQPPLSKVFATEDIYLFSYFYDRIAPLGLPERFTISELHTLTARVCEGPAAWAGYFGHVDGAVRELEERPEACLDLNFMLGLLRTGYEMDGEREVRIAKKLGGRELGWCLGASLPLLGEEAGWGCKVRQVS
ncbi:MAG: Guanosine-diphosphatase [Chrysothrix sp. TS-e1954]|nr:MAG: Guanosine-diphosphatase [Chrysothrix sp. TS-e1954]